MMNPKTEGKLDERTAIIIVDNDEAMLPILREMFESHGYRCETCTSSEAAIECLTKGHFHIMLADVAMPGMNGFELTEKARKFRPDMATIIMTGFIDDFSYDRAIDAGASDFIKKPFTMKEILHRVNHVKLQERLRLLTITDELTGLYNRRGFFTLAEEFLKLAKRQKKGIYMLYADLDHLKSINDRSGHHEGDEALVETAKVLKTTYRESDIVARIGGDEFVVIPVGITGDNIEKIIARLEKNMKNQNASRNKNYNLSLSLGVSLYNPEKPCSVDELISHADEMMHEHKRIKHKA